MSRLVRVLIEIIHLTKIVAVKMQEHREGHMRSLSWRAKVSQTRDRLIALSKQPKFHSMDLARIHPIIEMLAQGSYRFESLFVVNADGWKRG